MKTKLFTVLAIIVAILLTGPNRSARADSFPSGFVLKTFVCTSPVLDKPDGSAVGDNRIIAGQ